MNNTATIVNLIGVCFAVFLIGGLQAADIMVDGDFEDQVEQSPGWDLIDMVVDWGITEFEDNTDTVEFATVDSTGVLKCVVSTGQKRRYVLGIPSPITVSPGDAMYQVTFDYKTEAGFTTANPSWGNVVAIVFKKADWTANTGADYVPMTNTGGEWVSASSAVLVPPAETGVVVIEMAPNNDNESDGTIYIDNVVLEKFGDARGNQLTSPLLGYWDFEEGGALGAGETTTDKSGVSPAIDLTLQTDAAVVFDSERGNYVLDPRVGFTSNTGTGGANSLATDLSKLTTPTVFTMSAWVKPRAISDDTSQGYEEQYGPIVRSSDGDTNTHMLQSMNSGLWFAKKSPGYDYKVNIWRGDDWDPTKGSYDGTGPWHHLLVTSDGYTYFAYIDGVLRQTVEHGTTTFIEITGPWKIGSGTTHRIDDVALFEGYCPPVSAIGLYDGTYTEPNVPLYDFAPIPPVCTNTFPGDPNLLAWYHFEEGSGTDTEDISDPGVFASLDATLEQNAGFAFDSNNKPFQDLKVGSYFNSTDPTPGEPGNKNIDGSFISTEPNDPAMGQSLVDALSNGFTVAAWINPVDLHDNNQSGQTWGTIVTKGGWDGIFHFTYEQGGLRLQVQTEGPEGGDLRRGISVSGVIAADTWTHVVGTWDPTDPNEEVTFYVNGAKIGMSGGTATQTTGKLEDRFPDLGIMISGPGGDNNGTTYSTPGNDFQTRTFRGGIDDVRLYDRILTAEEVACIAYRNCVPRLVGGDFAGEDCAVFLPDFAAMASDWQAPYDIVDLAELASNWLGEDLFYPIY